MGADVGELAFAADRIDFTVYLLTQKIDFFAGSGVRQHFIFKRFEMALQADDFFVYRILYDHGGGFGHDALLVGSVSQKFVEFLRNLLFKKRVHFALPLFKKIRSMEKRFEFFFYVAGEVFAFPLSVIAKGFESVGKDRKNHIPIFFHVIGHFGFEYAGLRGDDGKDVILLRTDSRCNI